MKRSAFVISGAFALLSLIPIMLICFAWETLRPHGSGGLEAALSLVSPVMVWTGSFGAGWAALRFQQRRWRHRWDEPFEALGLLSASHTANGRRYFGRVDAVPVDAWLHRDLRWRLQIEVQRASPTPRHVRFLPPVAPFGVFGVAGIVHLAQARGPTGEPMPIVADGDPVANELLADPGFRSAVGALLERHPGGGAAVRTTPSGWLFAWSGLPMGARYEPDITGENVRAWLGGLAVVAEASAHRNV